MVICHCNELNDHTLVGRIGTDTTVDDLLDNCGAGGDCGGCVPALEALLEAVQLNPARNNAA